MTTPQFVLRQGDCLEVMKHISTGLVDLILCDLPYGTTNCKWDRTLPFDALWHQYRRIAKENAAIVLFGVQPFTTQLIASNLDEFRYTWIWNKRKAANFLFGNKQPLKITEDVAVFYRKQPIYNPQKTDNPLGPQRPERKNFGENTVLQHGIKFPQKKQRGKSYEPNKLLPKNVLVYEDSSNFIECSKDTLPVHPTQKPIPLLEFLIRTYTNQGAVVLDNCMGSGSTGVACLNTNRNFLRIELDSNYFEIAKNRIEQVAQSLPPTPISVLENR